MGLKRLCVIALMALVAGCAKGPAPDPLPPGTPVPTPERPVSVALSPATGAPGTRVTVTLRVAEPEQIRNRLDPNSFLGHLCFRECGVSGALASITFTASASEPKLFTGQFTVPPVLPTEAGAAVPIAAGEYPVHIGCVLDQAGGCADRPEVSAPLRVPEAPKTVAWQELREVRAEAVVRLGIMSPVSQSPVAGSKRRAECIFGNLSPQNQEAPPQLLSTDEQGRSLPPIIFREGGPLVGRHGYAGCGAVSLDANYPDSFYLIAARSAGGSEEAVYPTPRFTRDRGLIWAPIPGPEGFEPRKTFVGFTLSAVGVTAWFSKASMENANVPGDQVRGSFTADGGRTWTTVAPACPYTCVWTLRDTGPAIRDGLLRSTDGGRTWSWASYGGTPFSASGFYQVGPGRLEAVAAVPTQYWGLMPLLGSEDGGATWVWTAVPTPPGTWTAAIPGGGFNHPLLELEATGSLLAGYPTGEGKHSWYRLNRGSGSWSEPGTR